MNEPMPLGGESVSRETSGDLPGPVLMLPETLSHAEVVALHDVAEALPILGDHFILFEPDVRVGKAIEQLNAARHWPAANKRAGLVLAAALIVGAIEELTDRPAQDANQAPVPSGAEGSLISAAPSLASGAIRDGEAPRPNFQAAGPGGGGDA